MQLILMSRPVLFERDASEYDPKFICEDERISKEEVTWRNGSGEVAQKLVSELFQGRETSSDLKVALSCVESPSRYKLDVTHVGDLDGNIFKKLVQRFYDKVQISVSIAVEDYYGVSSDTVYHEACTTSQDMPIHNCSFCTNYGCEGSISIVSGIEDDDEEWDALMTITANINLPDEYIAASAQVPSSKQIFDKGLFCDVEIYARDGVKIEAHKCFLSACSPVLEKKFGTTWHEKSKTGVLELPHVSEKGVRAFLRYVYFQDVEEAKKDLEIVYELLCTAHEYCVYPLEAWAISHLLERSAQEFSVELAFGVYTFTRNIQTAVKLKSKVARIFMSNTGELENLAQYKELLEETPDSVLKQRIFRDIFP